MGLNLRELSIVYASLVFIRCRGEDRSHKIKLRSVGQFISHATLVCAENSALGQITLADQQADPNSPLYSAKTFEELGL